MPHRGYTPHECHHPAFVIGVQRLWADCTGVSCFWWFAAQLAFSRDLDPVGSQSSVARRGRFQHNPLCAQQGLSAKPTTRLCDPTRSRPLPSDGPGGDAEGMNTNMNPAVEQNPDPRYWVLRLQYQSDPWPDSFEQMVDTLRGTRGCDD